MDFFYEKEKQTYAKNLGYKFVFLDFITKDH
jgi:hypothetical protein